MKAFEVMQGKLAQAQDLDAVMLVGWEAFEFISLVAYKYGGLKSDRFATWMWAMGPATDGTGLLEPGPSRSGARLGIDPEDLDWRTENEAFANLASLAAELEVKLRDAALDPRPERVYDVKACARAAEAAAELHGLLALDA